jgi:hypothetical protein
MQHKPSSPNRSKEEKFTLSRRRAVEVPGCIFAKYTRFGAMTGKLSMGVFIMFMNSFAGTGGRLKIRRPETESFEVNPSFLRHAIIVKKKAKIAYF